MAPSTLLVISLVLAISMQSTLGHNLNCKDLDAGACAYAVESSGKRCVLKKSMISNEYMCATSEIVANKLNEFIETEECINACGVNRKALGISSNSLIDRTFAGKLCSNACYNSCPNIVDLYFNLAAGEGVYLPKFCEARKSNARREMIEIPNVLTNLGDIAYSTGPSAETPSILDATQSIQASTILQSDTPAWVPYADGPDFEYWGPDYAPSPSTLDTTQSLQASTVVSDTPAWAPYVEGPDFGYWGPDYAPSPSTPETAQSLEASTVLSDTPAWAPYAEGPDFGYWGPDYAPSPSTLDTTQSLQASKDVLSDNPAWAPYAEGPDFGYWGPDYAPSPSTLDKTQSLQASKDVLLGNPAWAPYAEGPEFEYWGPEYAPSP